MCIKSQDPPPPTDRNPNNNIVFVAASQENEMGVVRVGGHLSICLSGAMSVSGCCVVQKLPARDFSPHHFPLTFPFSFTEKKGGDIIENIYDMVKYMVIYTYETILGLLKFHLCFFLLLVSYFYLSYYFLLSISLYITSTFPFRTRSCSNFMGHTYRRFGL